MNALDIVLSVIVLTYAVRGMRRGLLLGVLDLLCLVAAFAVSLAGYRGLAPILARVRGLDGEAATIAAFFVLFVLAGTLYTLVTYALLSMLHSRSRVRKPKRTNQLLGLIPGVIQGAVMAGLLATAVGVLPLHGSITSQSQNSRLSPLFHSLSTRVAPSVERQLALDSRPTLLRVHAPGNTERVTLHFPKNLRVSPDPAAEARMLELINRDRAAHGLRPLVMTEQLRDVARAHSAEMFELSYFAHVSPRTGEPADRLAAAGVKFLLAGENLAYQPDVVTAHRELMNSPGHRRNLLSPLYERIGIGVMRGGAYGQMYTQEFAD